MPVRKIRRPLTTIRDRETVRIERVEVPIQIERSIETVKEVLVPDPVLSARLEELARKLAEAQAALDAERSRDAPAEGSFDEIERFFERQSAARENLAAANAETVPDEPPASIADLIDLSLTPRENHEILQKKYAALMSEREWWLNTGDDKSKAMELLRKAERIESGIQWNRARRAEVI